MDAANPINQGQPPPSESALDGLITRICRATSEAEEAGSYLYRLRVWPARTARNPKGGGQKKDVPSLVERGDGGWPLSALLDEGDIYRIARALLARALLATGCESGEGFARDVDLILLSPPIGSETTYKEGQPEKLGLIRIPRAELEAAQAAASPTEIAKATGEPPPVGGVESPQVQQSLTGALEGILQHVLQGRRLEFERDRDATVQLQATLVKWGEGLARQQDEFEERRRRDLEYQRLQDEARLQRAAADLALAKTSAELTDGIRAMAERVRNPDPSKTIGGRIWAAVEKPVVGLLNAAAVGVATGAPAVPAPALPAPAAAPALPAPAAAQPAPAAADGRPDRPILVALLDGLAGLVRAEGAWGARPVADLVAEARGWSAMAWAERFPGVPPDLVTRLQPELLALPVQLVIGGLASDLGVAVPSAPAPAAPPAGGAS